MTGRPAEELLAHLRELDRANAPVRQGRAVARARAAIVDEELRDLYGVAGVPDGVALVALGGYGRGMLLPGSDIDLLILHDRVKDIDRVAERLFYPLWDSGLKLGHNVRTVKECIAEAEARIDVASAMLDARAVAGDEAMCEAMVTSIRSVVRRSPKDFALRLREDAADRHERFGSVASDLEPDLKEGAGGLRDLNALGWLAIALDGEDLEALTDSQLLGAREADAIDEAEEFLIRLRSTLHLVTGGRLDRLVLDHQPAIAEMLGFEDDTDMSAADALMRATFERGREARWVVDVVFERLLEPSADTGTAIAATPEAVMAAFADAAESGRALPLASLEAVDAIDLPEGVVWSDEVRDAFLRMLRSGRAAAAIEEMDRAGVLVRYLPDWAPVRYRPQRDPFHRYTVDVHLLRALGGMEGLLAMPGDDPMAREAVGLVGDRDAVLLGALLHDIGKDGTGNHVVIGESTARRALERMGIEEQTRELVRFLVGEHLLLSDTATRRDLTDENLILSVAARIGDPERLAALYLVSIADAAATGPHASTPWRQTLLRELVAKIQHVFERGDVGADTADTLAERTEALAEVLVGEDADEVARFLADLPHSYVVTVPPEEAAIHFSLLRAELDGLEVRTAESVTGVEQDTVRLSVVCTDRPGLLAKIAGALSLSGFSILSAQVFTTESGVAVDVFDVASTFEGDEVGEERWRDFRGTLRKALDGRLSLDYRVKEKRQYYPAHRTAIPVEVTIENDASDFYTVIEIGCADRVGLLFDLTRTLGELEVDVHLAKIATYGGRVVDAFYVRDVVGRKIEDDEHVDEIRRAIAARLAE
ncbi:MAG: ACT domain-containing protein [Actinomycetota bacterium]